MSAAQEPHRRQLPALRWGARLERDAPGARYGIVLALLLITFGFMAAGPTGSWVPLVTVILQGTTLMLALAAAESSLRLVRFSLVVIGFGVIGGIATLLSDNSGTQGYSSVLSFLLVGVAPVAIAMSMWRRHAIDIHTVLGAICIYIFVGMFFAFVFQAIGNFGSEPFFAQQKTATVADYLYFSFVTLTTTGFGDLTARGNIGRAVVVLEALNGQIYLVTVVALLVSQLASHRGGSQNPGG